MEVLRLQQTLSAKAGGWRPRPLAASCRLPGARLAGLGVSQACERMGGRCDYPCMRIYMRMPAVPCSCHNVGLVRFAGITAFRTPCCTVPWPRLRLPPAPVLDFVAGLLLPGAAPSTPTITEQELKQVRVQGMPARPCWTAALLVSCHVQVIRRHRVAVTPQWLCTHPMHVTAAHAHTAMAPKCMGMRCLAHVCPCPERGCSAVAVAACSNSCGTAAAQAPGTWPVSDLGQGMQRPTCLPDDGLADRLGNGVCHAVGFIAACQLCRSCSSGSSATTRGPGPCACAPAHRARSLAVGPGGPATARTQRASGNHSSVRPLPAMPLPPCPSFHLPRTRVPPPHAPAPGLLLLCPGPQGLHHSLAPNQLRHHRWVAGGWGCCVV